jgi:hypothetical protein
MLEVDTVAFDTLVGEFLSSNTLYLLYGFLLMIATYKCQCNKKNIKAYINLQIKDNMSNISSNKNHIRSTFSL